MDALIDRIYESAFVPEQWPGVLEDLAGLADAAGGSLYVSGSAFTLFTASPSARHRAEQAVKGGFVQRGQGLHRLLTSRHAGFLTEVDLMSQAEAMQEPLVRDFWSRFGLGSVVTTAFQLPTDEFLVLLLTRSLDRGRADRGVIAQLDGLRPHLGRASLLAARLQLERARMASETLAALGLPALVLSDTGKVLAANRLVEQLETVLRWRAGDRIALTDRAADALLWTAVQTVNLGEGAVRSFPVRDAAAGRAMLAHVVPIRLSARDVFARCSAVLVLTPVASKEAPPSEIIQSLFDLTPSEARVARALASGMTLDEIAARFSVSRNTVRAQLRAVLDKTGCRRQAEVVALFSGLRTFQP